jgi:hypothetical protein
MLKGVLMYPSRSSNFFVMLLLVVFTPLRLQAQDIGQPNVASVASDAPLGEISTTQENASFAEEDDGFLTSYGNEEDSLFFAPDELQKYLEVIELFEKNGATSMIDPNMIADPELRETLKKVQGEEEKKEEPIIYPYYHLGSIVYYSPLHWLVSINGITITAQTNKSENELFVRSIRPNRVSFLWKPQEERIVPSLRQKLTQKLIAPENLKHRQVVRRDGLPVILSDREVISFSLEPNQLFYSEYMMLYEGTQKGILPPAPVQTAITPNTDMTTMPNVTPEEMVNPAMDGEATVPSAALGTPAASAAPDARALHQSQHPSPQPLPPAGASPTAASAVPVAATPEQPKPRNALNSFSSPLSPEKPPSSQGIQPSSAPPPAVVTPNNNEVPLDQLPSIDTIVP